MLLLTVALKRVKEQLRWKVSTRKKRHEFNSLIDIRDPCSFKDKTAKDVLNNYNGS